MSGDRALLAVFVLVGVGGVATYFIGVILVGRARWIASAQGSTLEADALHSHAGARLGVTGSNVGSIVIDRSQLQLSLPSRGLARRYAIRRHAVDGLCVDASWRGARLRVVRSGRPAWILTVWVPGPVDEWRERLASLGWLARSNSVALSG